ncbi:3-oxoacyl-[acyl-carrier-protein] reductase FabG-like [Epargyreus clarus]|uniref:3-oxoacyl-[acyl-carrier-protein] reductase FabG-like n=1 Tax=Epargyreus clarus TaxID=520877 RepID=UPI003C2E9E36
MSFTNKVVIVTGGSAGIGATTAVNFAREGAKVVIVGRNEEKLRKVADNCLQINPHCHIVKADITDEDEAKRVIEETIGKYGKLDILVNNAGIIREGSILDGKLLKVFDEVMNTNLKSIVVLTCVAAPYLIKTKGNIINISSIAGTRVRSPRFTAYSTSKAALDMLTRATALEMGPHGVRVNSVSPGPVKTEIIKSGGINENIEDLKTSTTLGRISDTQEVADLILYLASDKAKGVTGSNYICDNGSLLYRP